MTNIEEIKAQLLAGPQGGEPEVGVPQYQACIGVRDALELVAELERLRAENAALRDVIAYRWKLVNSWSRLDPQPKWHWVQNLGASDARLPSEEFDTPDAAIDAAVKAMQGEKP